MSYQIPANLASELEELDIYINRHLAGELDAATLKVRRVPFGCYEQRRDGSYMVRIRTTGGALTPTQLQALAVIAERYGSKSIHVTTRQEFQIHDIALTDVVQSMRELLEFGLAARGGGGNTVRNILVSPEAGIGPDEVFDPSPYAFALTSRLIAESDSWLLPRKFKIAFANSSADTAYARFNDLGFIAELRNGHPGFRVYVAGGLGTKPQVGHLLHDFIPGDDVYAVTTAVKRLFDQHGNRKNRNAARLRFLWNSLGEARFRHLYEEQLQLLRAEGAAPLALEAAPAAAVPPPVAPVADDSPGFQQWRQRYVEPQKQPGLYSVLVPVFLGNLSTGDATRLAQFLAPFGDRVLRATFGQNLRLRNIPEALLPNVFHVVREIGELASAPRLLGNSIACTGADTCRLGICRPKGALGAVVDALSNSTLDLNQIPDFRLNLSGCPNTCGQHMLADLGFYGNVARRGQQMFPAYAVVAGARVGDGEARLAQPIDRVSARDLPRFVEDVLQLWIEKKSLHASFADYIDAEGAQDIRAIADRYRSIPAPEADRSYYCDWDSDEMFSLAGKAAGECSAGLFDLIEVDLKQAKRLRQQLDSAEPQSREETEAALSSIALCSARALLITRGIEAPTDTAVFENFRRHFLASGLIDSNFEPVIAAAQQADTLEPIRHQLFTLLDAVDALYRSMDNSLRFTASPNTSVMALETAK
jgi:sulfite reductase (ferredoxin)